MVVSARILTTYDGLALYWSSLQVCAFPQALTGLCRGFSILQPLTRLWHGFSILQPPTGLCKGSETSHSLCTGLWQGSETSNSLCTGLSEGSQTAHFFYTGMYKGSETTNFFTNMAESSRRHPGSPFCTLQSATKIGTNFARSCTAGAMCSTCCCRAAAVDAAQVRRRAAQAWSLPTFEFEFD